MALTLNKQTVNLVIDQGTTFEKVITAKNTSGGNVTISSGTCTAKLRQSHYTSNNVVTFTTADSGSKCNYFIDSDTNWCYYSRPVYL